MIRIISAVTILVSLICTILAAEFPIDKGTILYGGNISVSTSKNTIIESKSESDVYFKIKPLQLIPTMSTRMSDILL